MVGALTSLVGKQHDVSSGTDADWEKLFHASPDLVILNSGEDGLRFAKAPRDLAGNRLDGRVDDQLPELLRRRDPLLMRRHFLADVSRPFWWSDEARDVRVVFGGNRARCTVQYQAFSPSKIRAQVGDFLVPADGTRKNPAVFEIVERLKDGETGQVTLCTVRRHGVGIEADGAFRLVKRPDPVDYYAGTAAMYLYAAAFGLGDRWASNTYSAQAGVEVPSQLLELARYRPIALLLPSDVPLKSVSWQLLSTTERSSRWIRKALGTDRTETHAGQIALQDWEDHKALTFVLLSWLLLGGYKQRDHPSDQWDLVAGQMRYWRDHAETLWMGPGVGTEGWTLRDGPKNPQLRQGWESHLFEVDPNEWIVTLRRYIEHGGSKPMEVTHRRPPPGLENQPAQLKEATSASQPGPGGQPPTADTAGPSDGPTPPSPEVTLAASTDPQPRSPTQPEADQTVQRIRPRADDESS